MKQESLQVIHTTLRDWALRPDPAADLREIFGAESLKASALLHQIRQGDFSWLPRVEVLPSTVMEKSYGAYARETGTIYLASDCPADLRESVLLEEIGHHIDALFSSNETPGDEGALFSAAVRGITLSDEEMTAILNEDDAALLSLHGREIAVECASRAPIPTTPRKPTIPATRQPVAPTVTVKPGAKGNITQSVDWVTSDVDYTLIDAPTKRGLSLVGGGNLTGIGNAGGTSKQNTLTAASNTGNTTLIAGTASTSMRGGSGDNWFDATRSQGSVTIQGGTGSSTMLAANRSATLVGGGQNNSLVAGTGARTLGQSLVGGTSNSSLFGNTLRGGTGRDTLRSVAGFSTLISGSGTGVSTTIGAAAAIGVTSIRVASAAGLAVGQQITGNGIAAGTTITAIAGTQLTLSARTTASLSAGTRINTVGNILIGQGLSNSLVANVGNDSLVAVSGNSTLAGGSGLTTLLGGAQGSNNWLQSGSTGTSGNTLVGGSGSNTLVAGAGTDSIVGGANQNLLLVTQANLTSISNDNVRLSTLASARNTLGVSLSAGTPFVDSLISGTFRGTARNLTRVENVGSVATRIELGANAEAVGVRTLVSGTTNDTLSAAGFQNTSVLLDGSRAASRVSMVGGARNDTLVGGGGNDTLDGGEGIDSLIGGAGNDSYFVDNAGDVVSETDSNSLTGGVDIVFSRASHTLGANVENLTYTGTGSATLMGNALSNTIIGNAQGNRLDGAGGIDSLVGGTGNDTYVVDQLGDIIVENAGGGTDLVVSSINYTLGGNLEQLSLTGTAISATGNALANTIIGNASDNSIDGGLGADSLIGGAGNDTYFFDNAGDVVSETDSNSLTGGVDIVFSTASHALNANVENLTYTGTGSASLTGNNLANIIDGSAAGTNTLIGGAGNDTLVVNATRIGTVVENSGADTGTDTIRLVGTNATLNNEAFNNIEVYDLSQLTGQAAVTLGGNSSGLQSLIGTGGADTIRPTVSVGSATLDAGAGADQFIFDNKGQMASASLVGGAGTDTLAFATASGANTLGDSSFAQVSGVEFLSLSGTGISAILGTSAQAAGIRTAVTGTGNDTLNASTYTVGITLDSSRNTGAGSVGSTLVGGAAGDRLVLSNHNVFNISSLVGGDGNDTLAFAENGLSITDDKFVPARISSVEVLQTKDGTNYIQLGTQAAASGMATIIGGSGQDTVEATGFNGSSLTIDSGAGADLISGSDTASNRIFSGDGNDSIILKDAAAVGRSTVDGAAGTDTISLSSATTVADSQLGGLSGVEILRAAASGASKFVLGATAQLVAGIRTVIGGDANDTLDASGFTTGMTLNGGAGDDSLVVSTGDNLRQSSIVGGSGNDTLSFGIDALSVTDDDFTGVTTVEALRTANGNNRILLGAKAQAAGISTIQGGAGRDTFDASGFTTRGVVFLAPDATDSLVGGAGTDTISTGSSFNMSLSSGIEVLNLTSSSAATLTGNDSDNSIFGGAGSNDTLIGKGGNDYLDGRTGADSIIGGTGNDTYVVDDAGDTVAENLNEGTDTVIAKVENHTLASNVENLILDTGIIAGTGNSGANTITGNASDNSISGGAGIDTLIGQGGDDTYVVDQLGDIIIDSAGTDVVRSSISFDLSDSKVAGGTAIENLVYTGSSPATLAGNSANNSISGNNQNNTLEGKGGVDTLSGGSLDDTYVVDTTADTIIDSAGTDVVRSSVSFDLSNTLVAGGTDIENLVYTGSSAATLTGNSANNSITGGLGADSIIGGAGADTILGDAGNNTLDGGADNDSLIGGSDADSILGGAGDDTLDGGAGDNISDTLSGGAGDDTYIIDSDKDVIIETLNGGNDTIRTSLSYRLQDNFENLVLTETGDLSAIGNDGANSLFGNDGANEIDGGLGKDTMIGGAGNDTYYVGEEGDWVIESPGGGDNIAIVAAGAEGFSRSVTGATLTIKTLTAEYGNDENDIFNGTPLNDTFSGGRGDDSISGFKGNDSLLGEDGNDTLNGGVGLDILSGGAGNDSLIGGEGLDSLIGGTGDDTYVIDFANPDIIVEDSSTLGGLADIIQVNGSFSMADLPPPPIGVNPPNPYAGIEGLLYTGTSDVTLAGNSTKNTITGGSGDDSIIGGAGNDTMIGGQGNDTYVFEDLGDTVLEETMTSGGIDQINAALVDVSLAADSGVENILLLGALSIAATGSDGANSIVGNVASNALRGNGGADTLLGNGGDDLMDGGLGADSLVGGTGNDTYILNPVSLLGGITIEDILVENPGEGTDEIEVAASVDLSQLPDFENVTIRETETPGAFNDFVVLGNDAANVIKGNSGNNSLDGGAGADRMIGGAGNDTYRVDSTGDVVQEDEGGGADSVISTLDRYTLTDNVENLQVVGGVGSTGIGNFAANLILGNANDNSLVGLGGADTIVAGLGNDTLDGGFDERLRNQTTDSMVGGGGDDYYIVDNVGDVVVEEAGGGTDTIELYPTTRAVEWSKSGIFSINQQSFTTDPGSAGPPPTPPISYTLDFFLNQLVPGATPQIPGQLRIQSDYYYVLPDNIENLIARTRNIVWNRGNFLIGANYLYGNSSGNHITATSDITGVTDIGFNDYMDGQGGADTMAGGLGDDTYVVDNLGDRVIESSGEGTDLVLATASYDLSPPDIVDSATGQTVSTVENLTLLDNVPTIVNGRPVTTALASLDFNGSGNAGNNVITGNSGNNILDGKAGNDLIDGGSGNDTVLGGTGNDWLLGGFGNDSLQGDAGDDTLDGESGSNALAGGAGDDLYVINVANAGVNFITEAANEGIDKVQTDLTTYTLETNVEILEYTGVGSANLTGNAIANTLIGGTGADTFYGQGGDDTIYIDNGGVQDDIVDGGSGTDLVVSDASVDLLNDPRFTSIENILLTGNANVNATGDTLANFITGNSGANQLLGDAGNDTLVIDALDTQVNGGIGTDLVVSADSVNLLNTGIFQGIENILLTGTSNINATGDAGDNSITGNSVANRIDGFGGADTLIGGEGNDTLVWNGSVNSSLDGGADKDWVSSASGVVLTNARFTNIENILLTGTAAINATGTTDANTITGNSGTNSLDGNGGIDTLIGGDGNDTYIIDSLSDVVLEDSLAASGNADAVVAKVNGYTLASNVEHLILGTASSVISGKGNSLGNSLIGNASNNSLDGAAGDDTLLGGDGNDTLLGGEGNDYLDGQAANNSLIGGAGNDTYVINGEADVIVEDTLPIGGTDSVLANLNYALQEGLEHLKLNGNLNLTGWGNSADNSLTGNSGNNNLIGYEGKDTLDGQGGSDTMAGGSDNDFYVVDNTGDVITENLGQGFDTVLSSIDWTLGANFENLILTGTGNGTGNTLDNRIDGSQNSTANSLTGNNGNDTFVVDGSDTVIGGSGTDLVESRFSVDLTNTRFTSVENILLTGTANIDATGNALSNTITGNSGDNILNGNEGADTLIGNGGNDTYVVDNASDLVTETDDNTLTGGIDLVQSSITYTLSANVENLSLTGGSNINATGHALANTITGNSGANVLDGGAGIDSLIGGAGNDTYVVDNILDIVTETDANTLTGGIDLVRSSDTYTLSGNVENLSLTGGSNINATGNALANTITGNSGDNSIDGGLGADTLIGAAGNDTLVWNGSVNSSLDGGSENDWVSSDFGVVLTNAPFTNIENILLTGTAAINATGTTDTNTITGNSGDNILDGNGGADTLIGGAGNDFYIVDSIDDLVIESISGDAGGVDTVSSSVTFTLGTNVENLNLTGLLKINGIGNDQANIITGNSEDNSLVGNGGRDNLYGRDGNDTLDGGALEDELSGGAGNDSLFGGDGSDVLAGTDSTAKGANEVDTLTGGNGADLFHLGDGANAYYDTAANGGDYALITDFSVIAGDQLQLRNLPVHPDNVNGYLIGGQIYGAVGSANSYLYRDSNNNGTIESGDNLIAAIHATGGGGTGGALVTADLNKIGIFV